MQTRALVVHPEEAVPGPATPGMERRQLFERTGQWAGWIRTDPGVSSAWHHHGGNDSFIYILNGTLTIDFGPGGRESVAARAGDFIFNPAQLVHRETTGGDGPVEAFVVRVGDGPQLVNLDGPEPG